MKTSVSAICSVVLLLAGQVHAAPSQGRLVTLCKLEVKAELGNSARVKLKRIRNSMVQLRVVPADGKATTVYCSHKEGDDVQLAHRDGSPLRYLTQVD